MPSPKNDIISFEIKINGMTGFTVLATDQGEASPVGGCSRTGANEPADAAFLKEVLKKIIDAYPGKPVSLCVDTDTGEIFPDSHCPKANVPKSSKKSN